MTFQEKSRWIALTANFLAWGWYFVTVARLLASGVPDERAMLALMVPVFVVVTLLHIVGHVVVAVLKPSEAKTTLDEREMAIARRAAAIGYNILCVGIVIAMGATLYYWTAFVAVNAVMLAFILAECVRYGVEITAFRRGYA
ncbi:hypothetical protein [Allosphingosinicella sp.]|uniref:hypothetical protein n=1 Tax=Allosphingosinicella sp. TaxID=2823234 RepID=UPI0037831C4C